MNANESTEYLVLSRAANIAVAAILFLFLTAPALSQSCPARVGPYQLQDTTPDGNKFRCRNDLNTAGNTNCTLSCTYKRPDQREVNSFSIYFEYTSLVQSSISIGSRYMCDRSFDGGANRPDIQVLAIPELLSDGDERGAFNLITREVFSEMEAVAVKCPNVAPSPPLVPVRAICPDRYEQFLKFNPLANLGIPIDETPKCERDGAGNNVCRVSCSYRDGNSAGANSFLLTSMWSTEYLGRALSDRAMCVLAADAPWSAHSKKQAVVHFEGADSAYEKKAANWLSSQILNSLESRAAACPASSVLATSCAVNFEQYQKLQAKNDSIGWELGILQNYDERLNEVRSELRRWNEVVVGIADPNYDGPQKKLVKELLGVDPALRTRFRESFGISLEADAPTIARTMRDLAAARVDYYSNAASRTAALKVEAQATQQELNDVRVALRRNMCPGSFEADSCDLSGEWVFWENGGRIGLWTFTPSSKDRYTSYNKEWDMSGKAKITGRLALLEFPTSDYFGSMELKFDDGCRSGAGQFRFGGTYMTRLISVQRPGARATVLVPGSIHSIIFEGRLYSTEYSRQVLNGRPIDVFHFKILNRNGSQATARNSEGIYEKLWGRFVRVPAFDHPNQVNIEWYFVNWVLGNGEWKEERIVGTKFEVR